MSYSYHSYFCLITIIMYGCTGALRVWVSLAILVGMTFDCWRRTRLSIEVIARISGSQVGRIPTQNVYLSSSWDMARKVHFETDSNYPFWVPL